MRKIIRVLAALLVALAILCSPTGGTAAPAVPMPSTSPVQLPGQTSVTMVVPAPGVEVSRRKGPYVVVDVVDVVAAREASGPPDITDPVSVQGYTVVTVNVDDAAQHLHYNPGLGSDMTQMTMTDFSPTRAVIESG